MRRRDHRRRTGSAAVVALSLLFGACGGSDGTAVDAVEGATEAATADGASALAAGDLRTFVGKLVDTDAYVAVQTSPTEALVYVCDGQKIWSLFEGPLGDAPIELRDPTGAEVVVDIADGAASGTVTFAEGTAHRFDAVAAVPPAGLFLDASRNGDDVTFRGWVRLDGTDVRGKTVDVVQATSPDGPDATGIDDGGAVTPTADPQPLAKRVSLVRCAAAMINLAKAKRAVELDPSPANLAARADALAASAVACGNPGTAAS